jgi:hypothetical protein
MLLALTHAEPYNLQLEMLMAFYPRIAKSYLDALRGKFDKNGAENYTKRLDFEALLDTKKSL